MRQGGRTGGFFVVPFGPRREWIFIWRFLSWLDTAQVHEIRQIPARPK
jgi:hypothetical protein